MSSTSGEGSGGADGSDDEKNGAKAAANNFSAQTISLRAQKKLVSKFASKRTVKMFIDDTSAQLFDNVYKLVQTYTGSKSRAHKIMKSVIKINMKLILLFVHDLLNEDELNYAADLREKFHQIAETCLRLRKPRNTKVTLDHLAGLFRDCEAIVLRIIGRHLSDKSKQKVRDSAAFFASRSFVEAIFSQTPEYRPTMNAVCEDVQELLDRGII